MCWLDRVRTGVRCLPRDHHHSLRAQPVGVPLLLHALHSRLGLSGRTTVSTSQSIVHFIVIIAADINTVILNFVIILHLIIVMILNFIIVLSLIICLFWRWFSCCTNWTVALGQPWYLFRCNSRSTLTQLRFRPWHWVRLKVILVHPLTLHRLSYLSNWLRYWFCYDTGLSGNGCTDAKLVGLRHWFERFCDPNYVLMQSWPLVTCSLLFWRRWRRILSMISPGAATTRHSSDWASASFSIFLVWLSSARSVMSVCRMPASLSACLSISLRVCRCVCVCVCVCVCGVCVCVYVCVCASRQANIVLKIVYSLFVSRFT